ncbi:hypothetical protein CTEN210_07772 [Chaetoceros tenuissimus]|uniref:RING-type domain-containing protein n=1 Tax=Chaetoceros tenuissimus TaxID=426638 RepID=A0AAD3CSB8_9STRA|nr:hypothetical protein CTEN210_07772 [Chaetoceros tenuissimus]
MSERQDSNNLGEDSSQSIHDANALISTSGSSSQALENSIVVTEATVAEDESDSEEIEWVEETSEAMYEACANHDWDKFEKFLSDVSTSKRTKKLVLEKKEDCRNIALRWGAPLTVIKQLIDIEGPIEISKGQCSWLHTALMYYDTTFEVAKLLIDIGGKDLVMMQSDHPEHRKRTALLMNLSARPTAPNRRVMDLFLKVGGLELLEIEDEDGYRVVDYCNEATRRMIITCLKALDTTPIAEKHIKILESTEITPRDVEDWMMRCDFDKVEDYLHNQKVSREAKQRCFKYRDSRYNRSVFFYLCMYHGPADIAERIIDLMGTDFLLTADNNGDTCLHATCKYLNDDDGDHELQWQHMLVELLLDQGSTAILNATNIFGETALHNLFCCKTKNFDSITLMVDVGGKDLLLKKKNYDGCTALHYASRCKEPNKDIIFYLLSVGGSDLREIEDHFGKKAEDYWSPELKQYIDLHTKTSPDLPPLSDDLQCPICFEIMNDVHIIPQCCHRFCKKCITDAYNCNGKKCPVCRVDYKIGEVRKDPLLCKLVITCKG